jgi:hypothetical protein
MTSAKPFGDIQQASIMVIGHDPRLQKSKAEAEYAFFLDYLLHQRPSRAGEARKYDLAQALVNYISELAGREIPLQTLYVTNLCNEFLPSTYGRGTVLIPDGQAERGVAYICQAISEGQFRLILPLSLQVTYHLARVNFFDGAVDDVLTFVHQARPVPGKAAQGVYTPVGTTPFLAMCGKRLYHLGVPVVPVLHVKQWPLRDHMRRYKGSMQNASQEIRQLLGGSEDV